MQDERKRAGAALPSRLPARVSSARSAGDHASEKLVTAGKAVGNDALRTRMTSGNARRDDILDHIQGRLIAIKDMQAQEKNQFSSHFEQRQFWREIADSHKPEYTNADPTRWHESARLYEQAAEQLCRGALGVGANLTERAMEAEQRALDSVPKFIKLHEQKEEVAADLLSGIVYAQGCGSADAPELFALIHDILSVSETFQEPPVRRRAPDPWWTEDEEEEEEGEGDPGGA
jgi:hypothetical protein